MANEFDEPVGSADLDMQSAPRSVLHDCIRTRPGQADCEAPVAQLDREPSSEGGGPGYCHSTGMRDFLVPDRSRISSKRAIRNVLVWQALLTVDATNEQ
jgi:hypothetical protein